jgi:DNA-binding transcriptional LysR family regulator
VRACGILSCLLGALMATAPGCGNRSVSSIAAGLQSENPSERIRACRRAAEQGDVSVLPLLVERLEDSAADVRFFAIEALSRMTGQTLGYRYYDKPERRHEAVRRWRQWLKARAAAEQKG